jgi:hypothetical protein
MSSLEDAMIRFIVVTGVLLLLAVQRAGHQFLCFWHWGERH